jgi:hypothetical protein
MTNKYKDRLYLPTLTELILIPIIVTLLLVLANLQAVRSIILSDTQTNIADTLVKNWSVTLDKPFINQWGVFVFWMGVGIIVYSLLGLLGGLLQAYRSDIPTRDFLRISQRNPNLGVMARQQELIHMLLRSFAVGLILLWGLANLGFAVKLLSNLFLYAIQFNDFIVGLTVVLVASFDVFLIIVLARLALLRTRIFD